MDCVRAQQLLSESFDGEPVDAALLEQARRHAGECRECTSFTRGLLTLRTPGPKAPESLIGAVMARVEEAAAEARGEAAAAAAVAALAGGGEPAAAGDEATADGEPGDKAGELPAPVALLRRKPTWKTASGIAAAAALILGFGMLTQYGIGLMTGSQAGQPTAADSQYNGAAPSAPSGQESLAAGKSAGEAAAPQANDRTAYSDVLKVPPFVSLRGYVYRLQGSRETSGATLASAGIVRTSRDSGGTPASVTVYTDPVNSNGILLPDGAGGYTAFALVTRNYQGRAYALSVSGDIVSYGEWPRLPSTYPEPASSDGSPIFFKAGTDDLGVAIYAPRGRGPERGFAIAPATAVTDPAVGNPNWTWWEPYS